MNWKSFRCQRWVGFFTFIICLNVIGQTPGEADGQRVRLSPGWNLLAVQVEPLDPGPAASFAVDGIVSVWTYDSLLGEWRVWLNTRSLQPSLEIPGSGIDRIRLGVAYWVQTSRSGVAVTIAGRKPEVGEAITLPVGWNLLGVPVVGPGADRELERISMISVLARAGAKYDRILKWENDLLPGADARRARSYNQIDPNADTEDFRYFDPERGYWIRVTEGGILRPRLLITLRSDIDRPPRNNFPGKEDLNITYHRVENPPEDAKVTPIADQRQIVFLKGEEVQTLGLSNVGGGILLWEIEATDDWLEIATEAKGEGSQIRQGVTTVESETLFLRLNAGKVGKGTFETTLKLRTSLNSEPIPFTVIAEAPSVEGEWKGFATIESVNGKRNSVPDIDLFLSIFEDPGIDGMFRAVIDSSNSLMWPVDVSLVGYLTDPAEGRFNLNGGFILPPGDVNNEPFDRFPEDNDADWNQDGEFDDLNPLPFPIQRSVSLEGALIEGNPLDGFRIEGNYTEVIHGMLPQAIELHGSFSLVRNSVIPFSSYNGEEAMISAYSPEFSSADKFVTRYPAGQLASSNPIEVPRDYILNQLEVGLQFGSPLLHNDLTIHLVAPPQREVENSNSEREIPRRLLLYAPEPGALLDPVNLQNVLFPDSRPFFDDIGSFLANLNNARGEWRIEIENTGSAPVALAEWSLRLVGQPVGGVVVSVTDEAGENVEDVTIDVSGLPYTQTIDLAGQINPRVERVPTIPISFTARRLTQEGYRTTRAPTESPFATRDGLGAYAQELRSRFRDLPGSLPVFHGVDGYVQGAVENPVRFRVPTTGAAQALVAAPSIFDGHGKAFVYGQAPLNVELQAVGIPSSNVRWEVELDQAFGGEGLELMLPEARRSRLDYLVDVPSVRTLFLFDGDEVIDSITIVAVRTLYSIGSGAGSLPNPDPLSNGSESAATRSDNPIQPQAVPVFQDLDGNGERDLGEPDSLPMAAEFLMIQHMYAASADIDLAPFTDGRDSFNASSTYGGSFDDDKLSSVESPFSRQASNNAQTDSANAGFVGEDHDYTLLPGTWVSSVNNRDQGVARGYNTADGKYDPPKGPVEATADDGVDYQVHRMACRLGSTIVAAMPAQGSVGAAKSVSLTPLELKPSGNPEARNIGLRLNLNPFARQAR